MSNMQKCILLIVRCWSVTPTWLSPFAVMLLLVPGAEGDAWGRLIPAPTVHAQPLRRLPSPVRLGAAGVACCGTARGLVGHLTLCTPCSLYYHLAIALGLLPVSLAFAFATPHTHKIRPPRVFVVTVPFPGFTPRFTTHRSPFLLPPRTATLSRSNSTSESSAYTLL